MPAHRTKENQGIVATESRHTVEGMARGREKKRKSPPRKKPPTKKENPLLAAPLASFSCPLRASLSSCGRLRRPSSLLLLSRFFRAAAPPYPFRFSSTSLPLLRRLRRLTLPRALVGGWRRPLALLSYTMKSRLSETHMGIGVPLSPDCENQRFSCQGLLRLSLSEACFVTVTCHELFFFCHNNIFLDYHCVDVLGYTALNFKAFGHKFLSFGKFFLLIRKKFVPL